MFKRLHSIVIRISALIIPWSMSDLISNDALVLRKWTPKWWLKGVYRSIHKEQLVLIKPTRTIFSPRA
jgi:hypothetical protein